jgi:hypothetical protein
MHSCAVADRLQAKQSKKGVGSMGSAPDSSGAATGGKKAKQKRAEEPNRAESPLGSDEETRAVQEATIQGLTVELERAIVEQEELRVQLERTQLERVRAVAHRDEAIQALEVAHTQSEEMAAQLEKLHGMDRPQPAAAAAETTPMDPAQMPELGQDVAAAAAAVAESLISVPVADVDAVEAAATKIQAVERGRVARANSPSKVARAATAEAGTAGEDEFVSTDPAAEEAAATKIQAMHRGKAARQQVV